MKPLKNKFSNNCIDGPYGKICSKYTFYLTDCIWNRVKSKCAESIFSSVEDHNNITTLGIHKTLMKQI